MDNRQGHFVNANLELSAFLRRVDGLSEGTFWINERDLQVLYKCLAGLGPELQNSMRLSDLDPNLQEEIGKYILHLRELQTAIEKIRCIMLARRAQLEADRQHLNGLQNWLTAYHQTA